MCGEEKTIKKIRGAHLLQSEGSLIFCDTCEKIIGSINTGGYNYIKLLFLCTCDNYGSIEIIKGGHEEICDADVHKMPGEKRIGMLYCEDCNTPLLSVIEERIKNYSFSMECVCGQKYDRKPKFEKRFGELIELYKKEHGERRLHIGKNQF